MHHKCVTGSIFSPPYICLSFHPVIDLLLNYLKVCSDLFDGMSAVDELMVRVPQIWQQVACVCR